MLFRSTGYGGALSARTLSRGGWPLARTHDDGGGIGIDHRGQPYVGLGELRHHGVEALDDSVESGEALDAEFVVTADLPASGYPKVMSMAITAGARVESFIVRIAASVRSSRI